MFQKCFKVFQSCLFALKSSQLPDHREGLFLSTPFNAQQPNSFLQPTRQISSPIDSVLYIHCTVRELKIMQVYWGVKNRGHTIPFGSMSVQVLDLK